MAHEITDTDSIFSVRTLPWHGLGHVLPDYPDRDTAQSLVLPWEPVSEPIYRKVPSITPDGVPTHTFEPIEGHQHYVRSDNDQSLSVNTDTWAPALNSDLFDIAEAIQGDDTEIRLETGGSLKGGRKVWLLLRLNEPIEVPGDPNGATLVYYALQNSHDGQGSCRGQAVNTRIVCANTSAAADLDAKQHGTEFVFRHTSSIRDRIAEARTALAGWRASIENWKQMQLHLVDIHLSEEQVTDFIQSFVPEPAADIVSDRVRANIASARADLREILASPTCEGIDRTAYGLVQAATEYANWFRGVRGADETARAESRFNRAMLKRSDLVASATRIALAL